MADRDWKPTACILCECNCGLEVELGGDDGRHLIRLRGDKRHPSSQGYACEKPHRLDHYQHGKDRVTSPLRRRADGTFEEIDWDTAIREVAARLAAVRDEHGGASIFDYGGGGQGNHLPGAYAVATRRALGMRYRSSALAQEKTGEFWVSERMMGSATRADFEARLTISKNVLTRRLEHLVEHGVLARVDSGVHGTRYEYELTPMGKDLTVVITALRQWADRWVFGAGKEPVLVVDKRTGRPVPRLRITGEDGAPLGGRELELRPGPGASKATLARFRGGVVRW